MMQRFKQKPNIIEAMQAPFDVEDLLLIQQWTGASELTMTTYGLQIPVVTREGHDFQMARRGDWVVRDPEDGIMCVVSSETFESMFEVANDDDS